MNIKKILMKLFSIKIRYHKYIIAKVRYNKPNVNYQGIKLLTVPKNCDINVGDYVILDKITPNEIRI